MVETYRKNYIFYFLWEENMKKNITLIFVIILFFTSFCVNLNAEEQSLVLYHDSSDVNLFNLYENLYKDITENWLEPYMKAKTEFEKAEAEKKRAERELSKAKSEKQRAEQEFKKAEAEKKRAEQEFAKAVSEAEAQKNMKLSLGSINNILKNYHELTSKLNKTDWSLFFKNKKIEDILWTLENDSLPAEVTSVFSELNLDVKKTALQLAVLQYCFFVLKCEKMFGDKIKETDQPSIISEIRKAISIQDFRLVEKNYYKIEQILDAAKE